MDIIIEKGCDLDVHKETVVACIMGTGIRKEIRTYTTMINDLLRLKGWLQETGITHVAMESTGGYWKPVFNDARLWFNKSNSECGTMIGARSLFFPVHDTPISLDPLWIIGGNVALIRRSRKSQLQRKK